MSLLMMEASPKRKAQPPVAKPTEGNATYEGQWHGDLREGYCRNENVAPLGTHLGNKMKRHDLIVSSLRLFVVM